MKTPLFTIIMVITLIVLGGQTIKKACKTGHQVTRPPKQSRQQTQNNPERSRAWGSFCVHRLLLQITLALLCRVHLFQQRALLVEDAHRSTR
jgi:hypothetical protein